MLSQSGHGIQEPNISIYSLEIAVQKDPFSCGLFALNAISHHYLQQNSPLLQSDPLSLAHYQMEIALEFLKEGAVSSFLYRDASHQIMANNEQQTAENDTNLLFILSNISPPVYVQPLLDIPPVSSVLQAAGDPLSHVSPHNTTNNQTEDFPNCPMAQDFSDHPMAKDLSDYPVSNPSLLTEDLIIDFSIDPDLCDSPIDRPPSSTFASSSAFASETSSALASELDLPLPSSPKEKKQVGLLDFFSKIPSEELHTRWWRKQENEERDQEEYAEQKQKDEAEKSCKQAHKQEKNRISQSKWWERLKKEKGRAELQDSSVSLLSMMTIIYSWFLGGIHA